MTELPRRADSLRSPGGFTLLEVMAALMILGILLTAVLYSFAQGIRAQARMQNVTIAALNASEKALETFTDLENRPGPGESDEFDLEPPYDFIHGTRAVEQNELIPNIQEISITLSWESGTGGRKGRRSPQPANASQSLEICFLQAQLPVP